MTDLTPEELKLCPCCGALPIDWSNNPFTDPQICGLIATIEQIQDHPTEGVTDVCATPTPLVECALTADINDEGDDWIQVTISGIGASNLTEDQITVALSPIVTSRDETAGYVFFDEYGDHTFVTHGDSFSHYLDGGVRFVRADLAAPTANATLVEADALRRAAEWCERNALSFVTPPGDNHVGVLYAAELRRQAAALSSRAAPSKLSGKVSQTNGCGEQQ